MKFVLPILLSIISATVILFTANARAYDIVESPYLSGDWGGARTTMSGQGINFMLGYGSEAAHNFTGGTSQLTDYTDQWVIGVDLDFEKMGWWKGGEFVVIETDRNGNNLNADANIGNDMLTQEVYGRGQTWHMTKFWYDQKFADGLVEWRFGRMLAGEEFDAFSCDYQNLSFCGSPPGNLVGNYWVNWPTSVWGTSVKVRTTKETSFKIGALQDNPTYVSDSYAQKYGWTLDNPGGSQGTLIPLEFNWTPTFNGHPGTYRFGGWYDTALAPDLASANSLASQWGYFIGVEQYITGTKGTAGWSVFFNATQVDPATAATDRQIALGGEYHGTFQRMNDFAGLAIAATNNNSRYAHYMIEHNTQSGQTQIVGDRDEYDAEVFYSYSPIASIYLRPNLQYVLQPGGIASNTNALVLGLKSGVTF